MSGVRKPSVYYKLINALGLSSFLSNGLGSVDLLTPNREDRRSVGLYGRQKVEIKVWPWHEGC